MAVKKDVKPEEKIRRPTVDQKKVSQPDASGVASRGGSRQGNIGHQANDQNGAHR